MTDMVPWLEAGAAGALLGVFFYGGLWWTVRCGLGATHAERWFLVSVLLRTGVTVTGFYLVTDGQWQRALACLIGFIAARLIVTLLAAHGLDTRRAS